MLSIAKPLLCGVLCIMSIMEDVKVICISTSSGRQQQPLILQHNFVKPSQHCKVKKKQNSILSPIRLLIFLLQPTRKMRNELILFQAESQPEPQGADLESQVGVFYDDGDDDRNSIDIRLTTSFPTKSASWGALISLQASWTGAWWVQSIIFLVQLYCCNRSGGNSLSVLSFGDGEDIKKCRPLGSPCMNCIKVSILIISCDMEHPSESLLNRFWKVQTGLDELVGPLAAQNFHFFWLATRKHHFHDKKYPHFNILRQNSLNYWNAC